MVVDEGDSALALLNTGGEARCLLIDCWPANLGPPRKDSGVDVLVVVVVVLRGKSECPLERTVPVVVSASMVVSSALRTAWQRLVTVSGLDR